MEESILRVWVAAADLESAQQRADTAQFDLVDAVNVAPALGRGMDEVSTAAG